MCIKFYAIEDQNFHNDRNRWMFSLTSCSLKLESLTSLLFIWWSSTAFFMRDSYIRCMFMGIFFPTRRIELRLFNIFLYRRQSRIKITQGFCNRNITIINRYCYHVMYRQNKTRTSLLAQVCFRKRKTNNKKIKVKFASNIRPNKRITSIEIYTHFCLFKQLVSKTLITACYYLSVFVESPKMRLIKCKNTNSVNIWASKPIASKNIVNKMAIQRIQGMGFEFHKTKDNIIYA